MDDRRAYYDDGVVTIYHGDALDVLPDLTSATVVLLDPPYSTTPNAVRGRDDGAAGTIGAPAMLLSEALRHTRRLLVDGGIAPLICDWRRLPDTSYLASLTGLRLSTCIAWTRNRPGTGGLLRSAWDPILVLSAGAPNAVDRAAVPNTVNIDYPSRRMHPYEKPLGLWAHVLQRVPPGLVVDPFMGAGGGALDAVRYGHRFIGVEINEDYCHMAAERAAGRLDISGPMGGHKSVGVDAGEPVDSDPPAPHDDEAPLHRCIVCGHTIELDDTVDDLRAEHVQMRHEGGRWVVQGRCAAHPPGSP